MWSIFILRFTCFLHYKLFQNNFSVHIVMKDYKFPPKFHSQTSWNETSFLASYDLQFAQNFISKFGLTESGIQILWLQFLHMVNSIVFWDWINWIQSKNHLRVYEWWRNRFYVYLEVGLLLIWLALQLLSEVSVIFQVSNIKSLHNITC